MRKILDTIALEGATEVYFNGELVWKLGQVSEDGKLLSIRRDQIYLTLKNEAWKTDGTQNVLAFRRTSFLGKSGGMESGVYEWGILERIERENEAWKRNTGYYGAVFFAMAIYHLLFFLARRKEWAYFNFAILAFIASFYAFTQSNIFWGSPLLDFLLSPNTTDFLMVFWPLFFLTFIVSYLRAGKVVTRTFWALVFSSLTLVGIRVYLNILETTPGLVSDPQSIQFAFGQFFYSLYPFLYSILLITAGVGVILESVKTYRKEKVFHPVNYFVVSLSLLVMAGYILNNFGKFKVTVLPEVLTGFQVGSSGLFVLVFIGMAVGMAVRFAEVHREREKVQMNLIETLRESEQLKDEFLAATSHELRTPLGGIIGLADSLMAGVRGAVPETAHSHLKMIKQNAKRLSVLVNDLLDFRDIRENRIHLELRPSDISQAIFAGFSILEPLAATQRKKLVSDLAENLPLVLIDEDRFQQILLNLVENGLKFAKGFVKVSVQAGQKGMVRVTVSDDGPGIPKQDKKRVFEMFSQSGNIDERGEGYGMGLAIAKNLVLLHGGEIFIGGEPEAGTRVHFTLKKDESSGKSQTISHEKARPSHPSKNPAENLSEGNTHLIEKSPEIKVPENAPLVAVVDDEQVNRQILLDHLSLGGYRVKTYESGLDFVAEFKKNDSELNELSLLVLDLMMPYLNGFEVLKQIRKKKTHIQLPALILTAKNRATDFSEGLNLGANDYITKPFEVEDLLGKTRNLVEISRGEQKLKDLRSGIYRQLHDHLGAELADLKLTLTTVDPEAIGPEKMERINRKVQDIHALFRNELDLGEDLEDLAEEFFSRLQFILLDRYEPTDRVFDYEYDEELDARLQKLPEDKRLHLFSTLLEVATNDLKYGEGDSNWKIQLNEDECMISMQSGTTFDPAKRRTGRGTSNISERMARIGGWAEQFLDKEEKGFKIVLAVPL